MTAAKFRNCERVALSDLPILDTADFRDGIIEGVTAGLRPLALFGVPESGSPLVLALLADDERSNLFALATRVDGPAYSSLSPEIPAFHMFERELHEQFGLVPEGHPWLKPVRFQASAAGAMNAYPFFEVAGDEIHELGVGPIHAGVIEPGHFRFNCHGETVKHLEIQLGYQHRGVEKMLVDAHATGKTRFSPHLAESIAGDSVLGHGIAYAQLMESLCGSPADERSLSLRTIALELERVGMHLGTLSAIAGDIAFQMGASVFAATRTLVINALMSFTGSRFGRGFVRVGTCVSDIGPDTAAALEKVLGKVRADAERMGRLMFAESTVRARFEDLGIVEATEARRIGMVGLAARASGFSIDVRADHPSGAYIRHPVYKNAMDRGDVFSRAFLRYTEILASIDFVLEELRLLAKASAEAAPKAGGATMKLSPNSLVVSLVEGFRGEILHAALSGSRGELRAYKVKDPSFNNWFALGLAMRGQGISDFPICNKSFDLSYCGFDL